MSGNFGPSFKAVGSIPAYRFVGIDSTSGKGGFVIQACGTTTINPIGIIQDNVSTNGAANIAQAGQTRVQCGASVTAGDLVGPEATTTARGVTFTGETTTAMRARWVAVHAGSTNSVIKVVHL